MLVLILFKEYRKSYFSNFEFKHILTEVIFLIMGSGRMNREERIMTFEGTLTGLGFLSIEILHLISIGKKEKISVIEKHFEQNDLVEYLNQKYNNDFFVKFDNKTYDNTQINKYFANYTGYIEGNESRKYGIMNEEDGLLLILALINDKVETECRKWSAND